MIQTELINNNTEMRIRMPEKFIFDVHKDFRQAYESKNKCRKYYLDMRSTTYIDSAALGMLLQIKEHAGDTSQSVVIENASKNIKEILDVANFSKLMVIN